MRLNLSLRKMKNADGPSTGDADILQALSYIGGLGPALAVHTDKKLD